MFMKDNFGNRFYYSPLGDGGIGGSVLVTGASGLVGTHLIKALVQKGVAVKALYRSTIPSFQSSDKVQWVQGDIFDVISLEAAMQNIQQVYHCAAIVSFNPKDKTLLHKTNVEGTANVVNACLNAGVARLLHVSSVSALGRIREDEVITEKMKWTPKTSNSEYGKSKYLAEMEVWRGIGEGLNAVMINPTIILGASDWTKSSSALFKNVYKEFPWYATGTTGFVDVEDVVNAMITIMESDVSAERFIISAENVTYQYLFNLIAHSFGKKPPHKKVTPFIGALVWILEKLKSTFTGKSPLITKETAATALAKVQFDNSKLFQYFPSFRYRPLQQSVQRICAEFKQMYNLP